MPLYGHELTEDIDPLTAGLAFAVSLDKDQDENGEKFVGQGTLKKIAAEGPKRKLIGLKLDGKRTARQGMAVFAGDAQIGSVTSGCLSPTLGYPIAMAYVDAGKTEASDVTVDLGGTRTAAQFVPRPLYMRAN
jgi:aminomethyltransferase